MDAYELREVARSRGDHLEMSKQDWAYICTECGEWENKDNASDHESSDSFRAAYFAAVQDLRRGEFFVKD